MTTKIATFQVTSATTITVVSAVSGTRIRVYAIHFRTTTARTITWRSDSTAISAATKYTTNAGRDQAVDPGNGTNFIFQTASGEALKLNVSATGTVLGGEISYYEYKGT